MDNFIFDVFDKIQRFKEKYPNEVLLKGEDNGSSYS